MGRLLQIVCRLGVSVASHSTDVGGLIRSHVNLIGIDILCKKQRDLAISDYALAFSIFGFHLLLESALCEPVSTHCPERWPFGNQPTLQKAMRHGNS